MKNCYPIKKIWRLSLDTGKLPEGTTLAYITPIFKGGARSLPANYRPISLTNHLTKIFERILRKDILQHLETNHLMNNTQHGFRSGRSTLSQLLHYLDSVLTKLEEGDEVDSIYLDFAKAFDKVDHHILLTKVASLNIGGKVLQWLDTFLKCRRQSVKVEEEFSESVPVTSGVPQGSVLGPLLFLILMIDIDDDILDSILGSFADDTRIWGTLRDFLQLNTIQAELNKVYHWAQINNMEFNEPKFEQMHFGKGNSQLQYTSPTGSVITRKNTIKDLGVIFEDNLLFHKHIISTVAKCHRIAGWSLRTFKSRATNVMLTLLKSLVVSQVEYACIIWSPIDMEHINLLENVQRKFTSRFACFQEYDDNLQMPICRTDYPNRLQHLHLYSLQRRRERYLILYIYKIIISAVPNPGLEVTYNIRTKLQVTPNCS